MPDKFLEFKYVDATHTQILKAYQKEEKVISGAEYKALDIVAYFSHRTPRENENLIMYSTMRQSGCK